LAVPKTTELAYRINEHVAAVVDGAPVAGVRPDELETLAFGHAA
jgi:hypothetical protein